jgi:low temperature requirement protein LtrA
MIGINLKFNPSKSNSNVLENTIAMSILTAIFAMNMAIEFEQYYTLFWLIFNILFVGLIILLFRIGYNRKDMKLVNIASICTFFFVIIKFFDIFSNLLDNGVTWLVFGVVLLAGSILFEKKRRNIRDRFKKEKAIIEANK